MLQVSPATEWISECVPSATQGSLVVKCGGVGVRLTSSGVSPLTESLLFDAMVTEVEQEEEEEEEEEEDVMVAVATDRVEGMLLVEAGVAGSGGGEG